MSAAGGAPQSGQSGGKVVKGFGNLRFISKLAIGHPGRIVSSGTVRKVRDAVSITSNTALAELAEEQANR
jgi:hypothetical protein